MQEKPKDVKDEKDAGTAAEDQIEHPYYYDDSHGYQKYDPADEGDEDAAENAGDGQLV